MTTTATNNSAVSPKIHSWGFFSLAIHSQHRRLRPKLSQTTQTAQFNRKLQPFYAKQTQFAESHNKRNYLWAQGLYEYMPSRTVKKQTQFRARRPRIVQPTINMQNKPNFQKTKINLTFYK